MNADDILKYEANTLKKTLEAVDENIREIEGACGVWSVKDIVAHLTSYKAMLCDVLGQVLENGEPTPELDSMFQNGPMGYNDVAVAERKDMSWDELLEEYDSAHEKAGALLAQIPVETRRRNGIIPWYGEEYDLEDFIVYTFYAHTREHCGQIGIFRG